MKDTRKRVSLYFNMEDEEEKALFEFLDTKKKNKYLKRLIENDMNNIPSINILTTEPKENEKLNDLGKIDFEIEDIDLGDD
jgi:hypothetical protein